MGRRKGSQDLHNRKSRKDKGKIRKPKIRFRKKIGRKTHLKLWFWERCRMSHDGYSKWNKYLRPKVRLYVFRFGIRVDVAVEDIANEDLLKQFALDVMGYDGYFYLMGCSGSPRTRTGVKWVKLAEIQIRESREGLVSVIHNKSRLKRYWFWRGD